MSQRISVGFLSIVIAFSLGFCVYKTIGGNSKCFDKGGILIKTSNGQFCIKEDSIIKE